MSKKDLVNVAHTVMLLLDTYFFFGLIWSNDFNFHLVGLLFTTLITLYTEKLYDKYVIRARFDEYVSRGKRE